MREEATGRRDAGRFLLRLYGTDQGYRAELLVGGCGTGDGAIDESAGGAVAADWELWGSGREGTARGRWWRAPMFWIREARMMRLR